MLSFSTKGSGEHPDADKVRAALRLALDKAHGFFIDGELQADAALLRAVADKKACGGGPVAGQANILVFPDLDAANIASKLVQILANATACGPILQGFACPVSDLSRSASVREVMDTTLFVAARDS
jgi:phosphate acetyltransferase